MGLLDLPFVATLRRNHAVEHATMHLLAQRQPYLNAVARTSLDGFYIYGSVDTKTLADATAEAIGRLQAGQAELAIHPRCGTNLVVAGFLAGLATFLAGGRSRWRLSSFPRFFLAATLAVIVAQPLGLLVQERITTSTQVAGLRVAEVTRQGVGRLIMHMVSLEHSS
jgi:ABC-type thiamin/hydroxymethylpyrimidine transport system permease subunit